MRLWLLSDSERELFTHVGSGKNDRLTTSRERGLDKNLLTNAHTILFRIDNPEMYTKLDTMIYLLPCIYALENGDQQLSATLLVFYS